MSLEVYCVPTICARAVSQPNLHRHIFLRCCSRCYPHECKMEQVVLALAFTMELVWKADKVGVYAGSRYQSGGRTPWISACCRMRRTCGSALSAKPAMKWYAWLSLFNTPFEVSSSSVLLLLHCSTLSMIQSQTLQKVVHFICAVQSFLNITSVP